MADPAQHPYDPAAARSIVVAKVLTGLADLLVSAKTTLTWLLLSIGSPAVVVGLLVPIRESGSMLPQLLLAPWIKTVEPRKRAAVLGALGQAVACVAMGIAALTLPAAIAGVVILALLAVLSIARSWSSIANKDVLGRAIPKGKRGRVNGLTTSLAGGLGLAAAGLTMTLSLDDTSSPSTYAWVVVLGAAPFCLAAWALGRIHEPAAANESSAESKGQPLALAWRDRTLRRFIVARTCLLGTVLAGPLFVARGQQLDAGLSALAAFVFAGGASSLLSAWAWGRAADRASARCMAAGATVTTIASGVALGWPQAVDALGSWGWAALYFVFMVGYTGVRVGRKTYVVDVAKGDLRTDYVAVSNTTVAVMLLVVGAAAASLGEHALAGLSALTVVGVALTLRLR